MSYGLAEYPNFGDGGLVKACNTIPQDADKSSKDVRVFSNQEIVVVVASKGKRGRCRQHFPRKGIAYTKTNKQLDSRSCRSQVMAMQLQSEVR